MAAVDDFDEPVSPSAVVADPRKFPVYVLVPGHPNGKSHFFLQTLGFRPMNQEDAEALAALYVEQAILSLSDRRYQVGSSNEHGRRCTIPIPIRGRVLRSGWILRPDGTLSLTTPFSGFATVAEEDGS